MEKLVGKVSVACLCLLLLYAVFFLYRNVSSFRSRGSYPAMVNVMETELKQDGVNFTSVILATDMDSLTRTLDFHCSLPCLQRVIVVWNNLETPVDQKQLPNCSPIDVCVLQQRDNSINNQFKPFPEIETDVVFITQVDVTMSPYEILLGVEAWKQFPHLIVGYKPWRIDHSDGLSYNRHTYSASSPKRTYNIMLSDAFWIHKKYLKMYSKRAPAVLYNEIHSHHNGDLFARDILMNIVVAQHLKEERMPQTACLWIKSSSWQSHGIISNGDSILWNSRNHFLVQIEKMYDYNLSLYESDKIVKRKEDIFV